MQVQFQFFLYETRIRKKAGCYDFWLFVKQSMLPSVNLIGTFYLPNLMTIFDECLLIPPSYRHLPPPRVGSGASRLEAPRYEAVGRTETWPQTNTKGSVSSRDHVSVSSRDHVPKRYTP